MTVKAYIKTLISTFYIVKREFNIITAVRNVCHTKRGEQSYPEQTD
jgi:hypothetical protein